MYTQMAIFTGVASPERAKKIVARIAKGNCTGKGKRGTWVSERPFYSFDQDKLFPDKGPKEQGDSTSAEGRVGLMDAKARIAMGDKASLKYFDENLLGPIQKDLLEFTWLTERYTCEGLRERTPFFFEYPCLLAMMLKEMKYGIDLGLVRWKFAPIAGVSPFRWAVGSTDASHNRTAATLLHPGSGPRWVTVAGLAPSRAFVARGARGGCLYADDCDTGGCGWETHKGQTSAEGVASWNASDVTCGVVVTTH